MHRKGMLVAVALLPSMLLRLSPTHAAENGVVAHWAFDGVDAGRTADEVTGIRDTVTGSGRAVDGVVGRSLKCDGFTTGVIRAASRAPRLGDRFTIEGWVAVQAYPWGWCPIVSQRNGRKAGYLFGMDARGRLGLHVAIEGTWKECNAESGVPRMQWCHVAGTFDAGSGITAYVNGEQASRLAVPGRPTYAGDADLLLGRNRDRERAMFSEGWGAANRPVHFAFDGLLDEVKVYSRCLAPGEIRASFAAARPGRAPNLKSRRLPFGPRDVRRFGAFYHHLAYCEEWDSLWRGSGPDVVVAFDGAPVRLIFWRGVSYAPCWVTEKENWFRAYPSRPADWYVMQAQTKCSRPT